MDRQTRKANFKKLQEPPTRKLRSTRSNTTSTLSDYFNTPEHSSNEEPAGQEHEPKAKKTRESRQTSPPAVPKPKKAPKLKTTATQRKGRGGGRGRSKQQPSISDFMRNEQLFAEVTAQHCIAENFSPDDIEMALALSKSEAEKHGRLRLQDTTQEQDEEVNLLDARAGQSTENVRLKLQKYGFRTAAKEDYNMLSIAALPAAGKRGKRCKWANKFTPLTLRNPVEQLRKVDVKVAALMAQQVRTAQPSDKDHCPFEVVSLRLQPLEATAEHRIINDEPLSNLSAYYVNDLFEVSRTPAHHLLKDWSAIQGRDLSPKRRSRESLHRKQQLQQVYDELEAHFGATAEKEELDELEELLVANMVQEKSHSELEIEMQNKDQKPVAVTVCSPIKEPPDKRPKMMSSDKENTQTSTSSNLSVPTLSTRCTSPDLFADSDGDEQDDGREMQNFSLKVYKNMTTTDISCYEIYSSDEVKTVTDAKLEDEGTSIASPIDLTQDTNTPESILTATSNKSLFEQQVFPQSPIIELDEEVEALAKDSPSLHEPQTFPQSPIIEFDDEVEALAKDSTVQTTDFHNSLHEPETIPQSPISIYNTIWDGADFELNHTTESKRDDSLLNISSNSSAKSIATTSFHMASKDLSLSFTQFETTKQAFQRSFSLTQSPRDRSQLEHSFKSPLNRRSTSFMEKPASTLTSPFSQSDASIDLTQDSDNDDNEGVLLSDDEINYSIWKADKTCLNLDVNEGSGNESTPSSPLSRLKTVPYFKTIEDLDAYLDNSQTDSIKSCNSRSPNKSALSRERAEFGILDAAISQPLTLSQLISPTKASNTSHLQIDWNEASFLETPPEAPMKRYSNKFKELLNDIKEPDKPFEESNDDNDAIDEFDRLVFQNSRDATVDAMPSGLDRLLMGEINVDSLPEPMEFVSPAKSTAVSDQLELDGQVYNVSICHTPKPDFIHLSEAELLQQLYNYGIKPLKRKQAVKLLEYIYNQTHPTMQPLEEPQPQRILHARSKSTPVTGSKNNASVDSLTPTEAAKNLDKQKFRDAPGSELLRFSQALPPMLCDDFECYVLQTNVTKKTPQPLLPLHIAWHNLLCANPQLHESVLMFEPIDLQEIYLYLKELGYRYDPKELKCFLDRRCIIFRYELAPPAKQAQRHSRKPKHKKANIKS